MKETTLKLNIYIPSHIYKELSTNLEFATLNIKNKKSLKAFTNAYWAISSLLINECCYNNDNLDYFVNIHQDNFVKITGIDKRKITIIKDWLMNYSQIFECNYNKCHDGIINYSYGYRLSPKLHNIFTEKNSAKSLVSFTVTNKALNFIFNIDIKDINRIKSNKLKKETLYIKVGYDSSLSINNQELKCDKIIYEDRTKMNSWEKIIADRLSKVTVDISAMYQHEGNDLKKLYWIGRILKATPDKPVTFSHGRLYRNPYWHCLPKEYRQYCLYNKKERIMEGFDVKNCFATLLLMVLEGKVSHEEYTKFKRIVKTGIYEDIAAQTVEYDRNDIKQPFCHWLFSNAKTKRLPINKKFTIVRNYFKEEFPEIYNCLLQYPEIEVEEGGKLINKSKLSVDCQWIENVLVLNTLAKWVEETFNVQVITLHDAICVKEDDYLKVNWYEVKRMWYEIIGF